MHRSWRYAPPPPSLSPVVPLPPLLSLGCHFVAHCRALDEPVVPPAHQASRTARALRTHRLHASARHPAGASVLASGARVASSPLAHRVSLTARIASSPLARLACPAAGSHASRALLRARLQAVFGSRCWLRLQHMQAVLGRRCWTCSRPLQVVFGRCKWLSSPPRRAAPPGSRLQAVIGRCCWLRSQRMQAVFGRCCWTSSRPLQAVFGRCRWLSWPPGRGCTAGISLHWDLVCRPLSDAAAGCARNMCRPFSDAAAGRARDHCRPFSDAADG